MYFHSLCVLLLPIIAIWQLVVPGASAASSSEQDELAKLHSCRDWYDIDPTPVAIKTFAFVFRARDMISHQEVIIKVYSTFRHFKREKTIFHVLKAKNFTSSIDKETTEIDHRKFEASWSHFVRLLNKCRMNIEGSDLPAIVIELLDEELSEAIQLEKTSTSRKRRHDRSLAAVLQNLPPDNATPAIRFKSYAYQLLAAVDVLHNVNIFHLDVKPQNVGLTHDGTLKLFDFGLSVSKKSARSYAGTFSYSAPEMDIGLIKVVEQSNQLDKMDIWSVGCTIYQIFTGHSMFQAVQKFIEHVNAAVENNSGPRSECRREAAYFYLKWTYFDSLILPILPKEYMEAERRAQEQCPQIFNKNIITFLQTEVSSVYADTTSEDRRLEGQNTNTEFELNMRALEANESQKKMRLDPSSTEPGELVALLLALLRFDYNERVTANTALTGQRIFRNFPHQNTARDKFGAEI